MKKKYFFKFIHISALILGIIFLYQGMKVYSQGTEINYKKIVDNNNISVHNFREYIEITGKERKGVTGYIIYLNKNEDIANGMQTLERLAQDGYNIYIIKNKKFSDLEKIKIGKSIVENAEENVNWVINSRGEEKHIFELKEWMINKGYRTGIIDSYLNSCEELEKNKTFEEINNELNVIRNKI
ncbi:hypothetical protein [uncultured Clostridium sp.]|uniref:hypothetical protein n=1 Tax=uncultured Clostridium sp. TaxID=59620 RepID=UPI00260858D4|nr:hypothetical protein [uncultured Clostridium sp.]